MHATPSLDELRTLMPELGFAVYAMEPHGLVTLEVYAPDGQVYSFAAPTEVEAIRKVFPPAAAPKVLSTEANVFE